MTLPKNDFGREDVTVRPGDIITLEWEGAEEKVVVITCHQCHRYLSDRQGVFDECERCMYCLLCFTHKT